MYKFNLEKAEESEIKPATPALAGGFFTTEPPEKPTGNIDQP